MSLKPIKPSKAARNLRKQEQQAGKDAGQSVGAAASATKTEQIAHEGNAEREAQRQRQLEASERWTRMTTVERQAVTATARG